MRRVIVVVGLLVVCVMSGFNSNMASASGSGSVDWFSGPIKRLAETPSSLAPGGSATCGGHMALIEVSGQPGYENACIFGTQSGIRLARYTNAEAVFVYAVAFSSASTYMPIQGLCTGMPRCLYGQVNDTFVYQMPIGTNMFTHALVKNFSKHLERHSGAVPYFEFNYDEPFDYIRAGDSYARTEVASVSSNGKWALIELPGYGFIRLNLDNLQYKRFAARDSIFPQTSQRLESTISDDGRWAVIGGFTLDTLLYEIDDSCGDILSNSSNEYFSSGTTLCNATTLGLHGLFPGIASVHTPRFSVDGGRLQLDIIRNGQFYTETLSTKPVGSGNPYYLALGDSFTSGEGEINDSFYVGVTNTATNHCHVSTRSYPYLLGNSWEILTKNAACSGSRIEGVQTASNSFIEAPGSMWPSVVSLGVGGNDVDFMGKLKSCIGVGTCEWAKVGNRMSTALEIKALLPKMIAIIDELKTNLAPAAVFVVGYPSVINDQPGAHCSALVGSLLDNSERVYMNESIRYINAVLKAAAEYSKVTFADIETAFQGERLCDEDERAMNGVRYGDDIAAIPLLGDTKVIGAESFHPTPHGHQLTAATINTKLYSFWESPYCNGCIFSQGEVGVPTYWQEGAEEGAPVFQQLSKLFLNLQAFIHQTTAQFSFLPNTFAPGASVRFELHSDVRQLGTFTAADDGSLQGSLTLPGDIEGYHTVHAYGQGRAGEPFDMYQTVFVDTRMPHNANANTDIDTPMPRAAQVPLQNSLINSDTNSYAEVQSAPYSNEAVLGEASPKIAESSTTSTQYSAPAPPPKRTFGLLAWLIIAGAGVGVAAWWIFFKKK